MTRDGKRCRRFERAPCAEMNSGGDGKHCEEPGEEVRAQPRTNITRQVKSLRNNVRRLQAAG